MVENGPNPAVHGVIRWRIIDLRQWIWEEYQISVSKQTLSRELRAIGYRKLSRAHAITHRRRAPSMAAEWKDAHDLPTPRTMASRVPRSVNLKEVMLSAANRSTVQVSLDYRDGAPDANLGDINATTHCGIALSAGVLPIFARAAYAQEPANMVPRDLGQTGP